MWCPNPANNILVSTNKNLGIESNFFNIELWPSKRIQIRIKTFCRHVQSSNCVLKPKEVCTIILLWIEFSELWFQKCLLNNNFYFLCIEIFFRRYLNLNKLILLLPHKLNSCKFKMNSTSNAVPAIIMGICTSTKTHLWTCIIQTFT